MEHSRTHLWEKMLKNKKIPAKGFRIFEDERPGSEKMTFREIFELYGDEALYQLRFMHRDENEKLPQIDPAEYSDKEFYLDRNAWNLDWFEQIKAGGIRRWGTGEREKRNSNPDLQLNRTTESSSAVKKCTWVDCANTGKNNF